MPIKGVWCVPSRLANGAVRFHYYTTRGPDRVKFWTADGARVGEDGRKIPAAFIAAYERALASARGGPVKDSFAEAIADYRQRSAKFARMKPKGQLARLKYLAAWEAMPLKGGRRAAEAPLAAFDDRRIVGYITAHRDATWGHSASAADEAVLALSALLTWCRSEGRLDWVRTHGIEAVYKRPTGARVWSAQEQARFLIGAPWSLRVAFHLALHTGLRLGDLTALPVTAIRDHHVVIPTSKSGGSATAIVPITPPLRSLLDEIQAHRAELAAAPVTVLFSSRGQPWTVDGFKSSFYRHRKRAGLESTSAPSVHDLRKTAATHMVILQKRHPDLITDSVLCDMFGWTMGTLAKMKRLYVSDEAVITAITASRK